MAWTTPGTAVAGEVLTAAWLNTNVRDNTQHLYDTMGLVLIDTETFTSSSAVTFDGVFTSEYDNYRLVGATTGSTPSPLDGKLRTAGVDNSNNNYYQQYIVGSSTSVYSARSGPETTGRFFYSDLFSWFAFDLMSPNLSARTGWVGSVQRGGAVSWDLVIRGGSFADTTVFDGIKFAPASGTITGKMSIYGYRV